MNCYHRQSNDKLSLTEQLQTVSRHSADYKEQVEVMAPELNQLRFVGVFSKVVIVLQIFLYCADLGSRLLNWRCRRKPMFTGVSSCRKLT